MIGVTEGTGSIPTYRAGMDLPINRRLIVIDQFTSPPLVGLAGSGESDVGINYRGVLEGQLIGVRPYNDMGNILAEPSIAIEETMGSTVIGGENTGNGIAVATRGDNVQVGTYTATCTNADVAEAEIWTLISPTAETLTETLTTQVGYNSQEINVTIGDGATNFSVGDTFSWVVTFADVIYGALDGKITNVAEGAPVGKALETISAKELGGYIAIRRQ